jgi:transglutaminase-like putative cysteine protease
MARLRITHTIDFAYEHQIAASYNVVRISPSSVGDQMVVNRHVSVDPSVRLRESVDCFGTTVHEFELQRPHDGLSLRAESTVVVSRGATPRPEPISLAEVSKAALLDLGLAEALSYTPLTSPAEEVQELAAQLLDPDDVGGSARAIAERLSSQIEYVQGVTTVHSHAEEVWEQRKGVCQDMAHVVIGALRQVGIPARYVSGYRHPSHEPQLGVPVSGESHAWLEYFAGDWIGYDPTDRSEIGERHVVVGRGRDYGDVPPVKGVYDGIGGSTMRTDVEITLL